MLYDAVVVLGGGIDQSGQLPTEVKASVEEAVKIINQKEAPLVIMSGRWSFMSTHTSPVTEAAAMKDFALTLGVLSEAIRTEEKSLDTIGNAYFVKTTLAEPQKLTRLAIITRRFHLHRAEYIFDKVFGPNYQLTFIGSADGLSDNERVIKNVSEQAILMFTRRYLEKVQDGDTAGIWTIMERFPAYGDDPDYSLEEMRQIVKNLRDPAKTN